MKHPFYDRFQLILSDPSNAKLGRVPGAGEVHDGLVLMRNGLWVRHGAYSDSFSDILVLNKGVHEPGEELAFDIITSSLDVQQPVILELGSWWAYYSMSFLLNVPRGRAFLVDEDESYLQVGRDHFDLNGMSGLFSHAKVAPGGFTVDGFMSRSDVRQSIDRLTVLHADIQGAELTMLHGAAATLAAQLVDYVFLSTHTHALHAACFSELRRYGYQVIASADMDQTFCCDGIIVACRHGLRADPINLGDRRQTPLVSAATLDELLAVEESRLIHKVKA